MTCTMLASPLLTAALFTILVVIGLPVGFVVLRVIDNLLGYDTSPHHWSA